MFRGTEREFVTLYRDLLDYKCKFYKYFRMSQNAFCDLLMKVEKYITKKTRAEDGLFLQEKI